MSTAELKGYLAAVLDVEKNVYLQERLKDKLLAKINELTVTHEYTPPVMPTAPSAPDSTIDSSEIKAGGIIFGIGILLFTWLNTITGPVSSGLILLGLLALVCILLGPVMLLSGISDYFNSRNRHNKELEYYNQNLKFYNEAFARYGDALAQYNKDVAEEKKREEEAPVRFLLLRGEFDALKQQHAHSKKTLERLYAEGIIKPKYRGLIMVSSLFEYIDTGICTELEGPHGAYGRLELYMRLDKIITQTDQIIARLDTIIENQYMLHTAIQESNRLSSRLLDAAGQTADRLVELHKQGGNLERQLAELQRTSKLTAYCSERTQKELAYMNRMNYLSGRNDNVFWNVPPT